MPQIQPATLTFLKQLKANNNREWFEANRKTYEAAKANFLEFTTAFIAGLQKIDPSLSGIDPKKTIFRINRDIRFSKDKSPYKINMGTSIRSGGKLSQSAGYYFHIQPGDSFAGGGCYVPEPAQLAAIRQEIDYNFAAFHKIISNKAFKDQFGDLDVIEKLKTNPKGYDADNPAIEYLKHKSFIFTRSYSDKEITSPEFLKELLKGCKILYPFIVFLNKTLA